MDGYVINDKELDIIVEVNNKEDIEEQVGKRLIVYVEKLANEKVGK